MLALIMIRRIIRSYTLCIFHDKKIKMNLKNEYFIEIIKKESKYALSFL